MELRAIFDEDAELYDRARPGYPAALFADLAAAAPGRDVLEIGCGTGKMTVALAERGYRVTGIELGPSMAAVARRNLARFPDATVHIGAFEDWPLPAGRFDVVLAATAFHWIDPAVRAGRSADALRPGGVLAVVSTEHIAGGTLPFFERVQLCYERFDPATPPGLRLLPADAIPRDDAELVASGRFGPATFHRYEWEVSYSTREYRDLLMTYSGHRALPEPARVGMLDCITDLIDRHHGGRITKRYLTQLCLAPCA